MPILSPNKKAGCGNPAASRVTIALTFGAACSIAVSSLPTNSLASDPSLACKALLTSNLSGYGPGKFYNDKNDWTTGNTAADWSLTNVTSVQWFPPGKYSSQGSAVYDLPGFCYIRATQKPYASFGTDFWVQTDSILNIEIALPDPAVWNGEFVGVGNGGYGGSTSLSTVDNQVYGGPSDTNLATMPCNGAMCFNKFSLFWDIQSEHAAAKTDLGTGNGYSNLEGYNLAAYNPASGCDTSRHGTSTYYCQDRIKNFGRNATHFMTEGAKKIMSYFYSSQPRQNNFAGCSAGGQQGMAEAIFYPNDYDNIIVGAPPLQRTNAHSRFVYDFRQFEDKSLSGVAATGQYGDSGNSGALYSIYNYVLSKCDWLDGATDGIITDPPACLNFIGASNLKNFINGLPGLSSAVKTALQNLYVGNPSGTSINAHPVGSELGWSQTITGIYTTKWEPILDFIDYWVWGPSWSSSNFTLPTSVTTMQTAIGQLVDIRGYTHLSGFLGATTTAGVPAGKKLIIYHGWADPIVNPQDTVDYYNAVQADKRNTSADLENLAVVLIPGATHCASNGHDTTYTAVDHNTFAHLDYTAAGLPVNINPLNVLHDWANASTSANPHPAFPSGDSEVLVGWPSTASNSPCASSTQTPKMGRPMCPYPKKATLIAGKTDLCSASSFTCQ